MAALHLGAKIGEEHRSDQATNTNVHRGGGAFVVGADLDTVEGQALEHPRQVFLIARQAVEALHHKHIEAAFLGVAHELDQRLPVKQGRAALCPVGVFLQHVQIFALRQRPADRELILDRSILLQVGGISRIDYGPVLRRHQHVLSP